MKSKKAKVSASNVMSASAQAATAPRAVTKETKRKRQDKTAKTSSSRKVTKRRRVNTLSGTEDAETSPEGKGVEQLLRRTFREDSEADVGIVSRRKGQDGTVDFESSGDESDGINTIRATRNAIRARSEKRRKKQQPLQVRPLQSAPEAEAAEIGHKGMATAISTILSSMKPKQSAHEVILTQRVGEQRELVEEKEATLAVEAEGKRQQLIARSRPALLRRRKEVSADDYERRLKKVATQGVVRLFNAVLETRRRQAKADAAEMAETEQRSTKKTERLRNITDSAVTKSTGGALNDFYRKGANAIPNAHSAAAREEILQDEFDQ